MEVRKVAVLPDLEQSEFPPLPEIPEDKTLVCIDTVWQNTEKEFAAGCIVNACVRAGKWGPVHTQRFGEQIMAHPMIFPSLAEGVVHALCDLVEAQYVSFVRYKDEKYFIPTPKLANAVLGEHRNLRVA